MVIRIRMSQVQVHMLDASSTNASKAFGHVGVLCDDSSLAEWVHRHEHRCVLIVCSKPAGIWPLDKADETLSPEAGNMTQKRENLVHISDF